MIAPIRAQGSRLEYLDSLRGLAALAVALFHTVLQLKNKGISFGAVGDTLAWLFVDGTFELGKIAVVLFFAISGFIIPVSLSKRGKAPVRRFVVNRFLRLYPCYWTSVALCLMVIALWGSGSRYSYPALLANLTMVQGFLGFPDINGVSWTLQIELVFYAACVILFAAGRLECPRVQFVATLGFLAAALLVAFARYELQRKLPVALPLALSVMFFGCLWKGAVLDGDRQALRCVRMSVAAFAIGLPAVCVLAYSRDYGYQETWYRYLASYSASLVLFMLCTTWCRLRIRPLPYLGRISYSVYLLHPIVASVMGHSLSLPQTPLQAFAWIAALLAGTILVSDISYRVIEAPAIALGRRLARQLGREEARHAVVPAE